MSPKLRILIPLLIITGFVLYTWALIVLEGYPHSMQKDLALILLIVLHYFYFTRRNWCVVFTGIYLLLLTFNLLSITPATTSHSLGIGPVEHRVYTPAIQFIGLGILVLYGILNFDQLTEMYLDYKEAKAKKKEEK
ncbi:hypothetical protein [Paraflavitalea pollutisoli]|uniref:hypothetical protein n=1 Tax=Paraflavitalea pollutisoli TaxID=3034143 RepID=UPI0023ECE2DD|nr:hypothetical protein [Paraflavitalea sp. H1-2-19X]